MFIFELLWPKDLVALWAHYCSKNYIPVCSEVASILFQVIFDKIIKDLGAIFTIERL